MRKRSDVLNNILSAVAAEETVINFNGGRITSTLISGNHAFFVEIDAKSFIPAVVEIEDGKIASYAKEHNMSIIINASLHDKDRNPLGPFIVGREDKSIIKTITTWRGRPLSARFCYPLVINNKNLFVINTNRYDPRNYPDRLRVYGGAVMGWGAIYDHSSFTNLNINEVDREYGSSKQIVGMLHNGNYFILTCEHAYYDDVVDFLIGSSVSFAYMLAGGADVKLFLGGQQINRHGHLNLKGQSLVVSAIEFKPCV